MSDRRYRLVEGGMQDRFHRSRAKLQVIGGGYGNGKTSASCVKALRLCVDYPGCNGLVARATYPRLNDTIRKEFMKWCPTKWIKRQPTKDDNTLVLTNGSMVNFRYVSQRGGASEETKSNLLSATYDWIIVDQLEDPEIHHKDFMDLMGRLRGNTEYVGDDPAMPKTGPRWFIVTLNPTRNWCYREIIKPYHDWQRGVISPSLLCEVDAHGQPVMKDGKPVPILELFEGSTYENVENVGEDYIRTMLATYTGSMRDRFVFGKWGALSGLVYPSFDETQHIIDHETLADYIAQLRMSGFEPQFIEGYDHGLARHSCYGLFFTDDENNVFLIDGWRVAETTVSDAARRIAQCRMVHAIDTDQLRPIYADPDIFRRKSGSSKQVGVTVADMFRNEGVIMQRGNNDINSGIEKNWQYLAPMRSHEHPITGLFPSAHFFVSNRCDWFIDEITEYYFEHNSSDEVTDRPVDRNDHAMDMWKYAMSERPRLAKFVGMPDAPPAWMAWHEIERTSRTQSPRHGASRGIR